MYQRIRRGKRVETPQVLSVLRAGIISLLSRGRQRREKHNRKEWGTQKRRVQQSSSSNNNNWTRKVVEHHRVDILTMGEWTLFSETRRRDRRCSIINLHAYLCISAFELGGKKGYWCVVLFDSSVIEIFNLRATTNISTKISTLRFPSCPGDLLFAPAAPRPNSSLKRRFK